MRTLMSWHHWLDAWLPDRCALCGGGSGTTREQPLWHGPLCPSCAATSAPFSPPAPDGVTRVVAAGSFEGPVREAILRLKYQGQVWRARGLARWMVEGQAGRWLDPATVLVPVPQSSARGRERGFNHAGRLAVALGRETGLRVAPGLLWRTRDGGHQRALGREARKAIEGAFAARRGDARVCLVDDVMTTGATLTACAHALAEAGVSQPVVAWTVAWTRPDFDS
jgi:ComF family protein